MPTKAVLSYIGSIAWVKPHRLGQTSQTSNYTGFASRVPVWLIADAWSERSSQPELLDKSGKALSDWSHGGTKARESHTELKICW